MKNLQKYILKYAVMFVLLGIAALCAVAQDRYVTISQDKGTITLYSDGATNTLKLPQELRAPFLYANLSGNGYSIALNVTAADGVSRIYLADLATENEFMSGAKMLLGNDAKNQFGGTFSADGSMVAYFLENGRSFDLYITELANNSSKKISTFSEVSPVSLSADKRQILAVRKTDDKSTLWIVPNTGGREIEIRITSNITEAVFSPNSDKIAAAVYNPNSKLYDLEIFPFLGTGGNTVVEDITNLRNLVWLENDITFLADKIAETPGPIFNYNEKSGMLTKVESPNIPGPLFLFSKNILVEREGSGGSIISGGDGSADDGGSSVTVTPAAKYIIDTADLQKLESLQNKSIKFISPKDAETSGVKGIVNIEILTKNNVSTVQLQYNGRFLSEGEVINNKYVYNWNTLNAAKLAPGTLPNNYKALKEFPDSSYTLTAIGKDLANRVVAEEKITVTLANNLTLGTNIPTAASWLEKVDAQDTYNISATSSLVGQPKSELNAEMLVRAMRINRGGYDEENNPYFLFQTRLVGPNNALPIRYGERGTAVMPETSNNVGLHAVSLAGEVQLPKSANATTNTLALVSLALPKTAVVRDKTWRAKMFVTTDIFSREVAEVNATNFFDAIEEWDNGQIVAVVRSTFSLPVDTKLFNSPTTSIPSTLGSRATPKVFDRDGNEVIGGVPPPIDQQTQSKSMTAQQTSSGVRFSWIDISTGKVLKAQDYIRYYLSNNDAMSTVPGYTPQTLGTVPGQGAQGQQAGGGRNQQNITYFVTFTYQLVN